MPKQIDPNGLPQQAIVLALSDLGEPTAGFNLITATVRGDETAYVIKDSDFPLLQSAITILASFFASGAQAVAPTAIASLILLLVTFRKKRVSLTAAQALVVRELERRPGLTIEQLSALLSNSIDARIVSAELDKLKSLPNESGQLVEIVRSDLNGKWHLVDV